MHFTGSAGVVASPDESRSPVAAIKWFVVLQRRGGAANVGGRLSGFGASQEAVAHLHRPVVVGLERQASRARAPRMGLEVVTIFIRLSTVEDRAFEFEPAISEAGREYPKTNVGGILQVMRQRSRRIFRGRSAMHECRWAQRRLARIAEVGEPGSTFTERDGVLRRQLHPEIVRMLPINYRLPFEGLAGLEKQPRASARKSEWLKTKHRSQLQRAGSDAPERNWHEPVRGFKLRGATWSALGVETNNKVIVRHQ